MKTILVGLLLSITRLAQTPAPVVKAGPMPRGADGEPDFQGVWEVRSPGGNAQDLVAHHMFEDPEAHCSSPAFRARRRLDSKFCSRPTTSCSCSRITTPIA